jgi:hypothetical protein
MAVRDEETRKLLAHIAARLGGVENLAARLKLSPRVISLYLSGKDVIPDALVLQVVDLVIEQLDGLKTVPVPGRPTSGRS